MRNPYENEPSDASLARLEEAYDKYLAEHDPADGAPLDWDEWREQRAAD